MEESKEPDCETEERETQLRLQQLMEMSDTSARDTWDPSVTVVFSERKGTKLMTLSEDFQAVQISLDEFGMKQIRDRRKTTADQTVITLAWEEHPQDDACTYTAEICLREEREDSFIDVILGMCENRFASLRRLAATLLKECQVKITRVQSQPFALELLHRSSGGFDNLASRVGELENILKCAFSESTNTNISLDLTLHVQDQEQDFVAEDMEFTMTIYGSETESEDVPVMIVREGDTSSKSGGSQNLDTSHNDSEIDVRFGLLEENIHRQKIDVRKRFDEQKAFNEELRHSVEQLAHSVHQLVDKTHNGRSAGISDETRGCQHDTLVSLHGTTGHTAETGNDSITNLGFEQQEVDTGSEEEQIMPGSFEGKSGMEQSQRENSFTTPSTTSEVSHNDNCFSDDEEPANYSSTEEMKDTYPEHQSVFKSTLSGEDARKDHSPSVTTRNETCLELDSRSEDDPPGLPVETLHSSVLDGSTGGKARSFLSRYGVQGTSAGVQRLVATVESAMKDDVPMPPTARGLHTILCLDTSSTMSERGIKKMKETAYSFIDGVEDAAAEYEMEENVAIVSCGGPARIVHHLSNDYSSLRAVIENLHIGGRSWMFETLLVCLCAILGRGGDLDIKGVHRVQPRVIVITDGSTADELGSTDHVGDMESEERRVVRLMEEFGERKSETAFPNPFVWVPIGNTNRDFLETLGSMDNGVLVEREDVGDLCKYQRIQILIGQSYAVIKKKIISEEETEVDSDDIVAVVNGIDKHLDTDDKETVVTAIEEKIEQRLASHAFSTEILTQNFRNVVEFKDESLPRLGSRVVRGPQWKWGNQDSQGPGTVINHTEGDDDDKKLLWVAWDNGECQQYRYGYQNARDVIVVHDQPRITPSELVIEIGCEVTRGSDWKDKYLDQDGGKGGIGVVIRKNNRGKVKVRWNRNGHINEYRFGKGDKLDLSIRDPAECLMELTQTEMNSFETDAAPGQALPDDAAAEAPGVGQWAWQWEAGSDEWRLYGDREMHKLEKEYLRRPTGSCVIQRDNTSFRVLFKDWHEKRIDGTSKRRVRRIRVNQKD
ncbi:uncharacterized protein LOC124280413 [Haliotis rubra]|uniref:uncharacterized protein LOC124280413 n=1 Tax=Haliotis rubra TaxID=36100 RepID=UPI001EE61662|nr:uncharacterized protein LOC124280413 [Haliotis rubra]XP_046572299.1 uncharacterized protein LOC124280413 [Haliotis rubra]XP_046572300.1 uncharacterized protein LOC124280413 [Haliotis rubra]